MTNFVAQLGSIRFNSIGNNKWLASVDGFKVAKITEEQMNGSPPRFNCVDFLDRDLGMALTRISAFDLVRRRFNEC